MQLKKINIRTEVIINIILNNVIKKPSYINKLRWIRITQYELAERLRCSLRCVNDHIRLLFEHKIILIEKFQKSDKDQANFYAINPEVLNNKKLLSFFNASTVQKMHILYNINNKDKNKKINHSKSNKSEVVLEESKEVANDAQLSFRYENEHSGIRTTAQDMLQIWNKELCRNETMSKNTARYLVACFKRKFNNSLEKWAQYVRGLKMSPFVQNLSKKIKNLLKWALSFKVINRIFEGGFGVTLEDIVNTKPNSNDDNVKIIKEITELDEAESCKKIRLSILQKYGPSKYITYMSRIKLYQENDNIFIKGNAFISDYVYTNFFIVTNNEMKKYYFKVKAC